ncbi:hypothetical protein N9W04_02950 [Alphaproteobacteria bacterium]|nr:hypothetical protein [Alphaproteobacteria bacterium]
MKTLLTLLLLIPSLSWGESLLRCNMIDNDWMGDYFFKVGKNNKNIKWISDNGNEYTYDFSEENEVFIKFDNYINERRNVLIILNQYTLELDFYSYPEGSDTVIYNYQCKIIEKQL